MSLGARIRECRLAMNISQAELANRIGVKQQSIDQVEAGKVKAPRYLIDLADALEVSLDWLRKGQGAKKAQKPSGVTYVKSGTVDSPAPGAHYPVMEHDGSSYAFIPTYDVRAAAGPGAFNADPPMPLNYQVFRQDWIRSMTDAAPDQLAVMRVAGDSMWETLHDGDHILVDLTVTHCGRDGLYVIRYQDSDELMVKRLIRDPGAKVLIVRSDNTTYPAQITAQDEDLVVIGRVIWLGRHLG